MCSTFSRVNQEWSRRFSVEAWIFKQRIRIEKGNEIKTPPKPFAYPEQQCGSKGFVERTKADLGIKAIGREVVGGDGVLELREPEIPYTLNLTDENGDLRPPNRYFWGITD